MNRSPYLQDKLVQGPSGIGLWSKKDFIFEGKAGCGKIRCMVGNKQSLQLFIQETGSRLNFAGEQNKAGLYSLVDQSGCLLVTFSMRGSTPWCSRPRSPKSIRLGFWLRYSISVNLSFLLCKIRVTEKLSTYGHFAQCWAHSWVL